MEALKLGGKANLRRYKQPQNKVSSVDARILRAIEKENERRKQREEFVAQFRQNKKGDSSTKLRTTKKFSKEELTELGSDASSKLRTKKTFSKEELAELGRKRYQQMMKWKADRKKKLEAEKQRRKPSFKAGIYHPIPPPFLTEKVDPQHVTPWKYPGSTQKSARKTPGLTSSVSKCSRVAKPLRFHSGATPQPCNEVNSLKDIMMAGCPTTGRRNSRSARAFRPPPGMGVTPFPPTPTTGKEDPIKNVTRRQKSFAPQDFRFQAPKGLKPYNFINDEKENVSSNLSQDFFKEEEDIDINLEESLNSKQKVRKSVHNAENNQGSSKKNDHPLNASFTIEESTSASHSLNILFTVDSAETSEETSFGQPNVEEMKSADKNGSDMNEVCNQEIKLSLDSNSPLKHLSSDDIHTSEKNPPSERLTECAMAASSPTLHISDDEGTVPCLLSPFQKENTSHLEVSNAAELKSLSYLNESEYLDATSGKGAFPQNDFMVDSADHIPNLLSHCDNDTPDFPHCHRSNAGVTPCPGKNKRRTLVTPPFAKLRPRTPCSRSTRRSKTAHCDGSQWTLDSAKKSGVTVGRKSNRSALKMELSFEKDQPQTLPKMGKDVVDCKTSINEGNEITTEHESFKTPLSAVSEKNKVTKTEEQWLSKLESSPWIIRSRGSSSSKKKKKGIFSNELEAFFNSPSDEGSMHHFEENNLTMGSQGASPNLKNTVYTAKKRDSKLGKPEEDQQYGIACVDSAIVDNSESKALSDLAQALNTPVNTPDLYVWGLESNESTPDAATEGDITKKEEPSTISLLTPALKVLGNKKTNKRRSKQSSVTFAPDTSAYSHSTNRFSVTPIRKSTRISMGFYGKVQANHADISPATLESAENSVHIDSPVDPERKSSLSLKNRISLLPGLFAFDEGQETQPAAVTEDQDLISWNSPVVPKRQIRRKSRKSNADTPARRSKRLSKIE